MTSAREGSCPNCGTELDGAYCSACGQHQVDLDRPFRELLSEGLSTFFAFDRRLFRTISPLVRRPGFLTNEFLAGRRERYVHPFKLYFALSLIFFLSFSLSDYSIVNVNEPGVLTVTTIESDTPSAADPAEVREAPGGAADPDLGDERWIDRYFEPLEELAENDPERLNRLFIDRLSSSLIALVPMVALLLQMLYWKPRFVAHLVFALHLHSFSFLVLVAGAVVDRIGAGGLGNSIATIAIVVYSFFALRRVYDQARLVTALKMVVLILGYAVALLSTMLATFVVTVAAI